MSTHCSVLDWHLEHREGSSIIFSSFLAGVCLGEGWSFWTCADTKMIGLAWGAEHNDVCAVASMVP